FLPCYFASVKIKSEPKNEGASKEDTNNVSRLYLAELSSAEYTSRFAKLKSLSHSDDIKI
ncbi:15791_t:CDS:1, partial [Dentiscutata erythropus]